VGEGGVGDVLVEECGYARFFGKFFEWKRMQLVKRDLTMQNLLLGA
jgi:hypothetical protein